MNRRIPALTPADCVRTLHEPTLPPLDDRDEDEARQVELHAAILAIADLDHVSEMRIVDQAAERAGAGTDPGAEAPR